jgi:hypothetical protein
MGSRVAQPSGGLLGATTATMMMFFFAAAFAVIFVLPTALVCTCTFAFCARMGLFDDRSRRDLLVAALIIGGMGTALFVWVNGWELAEASAESVVLLVGLWLTIVAGWAGPRLYIRQLHLGRFSHSDVLTTERLFDFTPKHSSRELISNHV